MTKCQAAYVRFKGVLNINFSQFGSNSRHTLFERAFSLLAQASASVPRPHSANGFTHHSDAFVGSFAPCASPTRPPSCVPFASKPSQPVSQSLQVPTALPVPIGAPTANTDPQCPAHYVLARQGGAPSIPLAAMCAQDLRTNPRVNGMGVLVR